MPKPRTHFKLIVVKGGRTGWGSFRSHTDTSACPSQELGTASPPAPKTGFHFLQPLPFQIKVKIVEVLTEILLNL